MQFKVSSQGSALLSGDHIASHIVRLCCIGKPRSLWCLAIAQTLSGLRRLGLPMLRQWNEMRVTRRRQKCMPPRELCMSVHHRLICSNIQSVFSCPRRKFRTDNNPCAAWMLYWQCRLSRLGRLSKSKLGMGNLSRGGTLSGSMRHEGILS